MEMEVLKGLRKLRKPARREQPVLEAVSGISSPMENQRAKMDRCARVICHEKCSPLDSTDFHWLVTDHESMFHFPSGRECVGDVNRANLC
jgi:hypothetical protein